MPKYIIPCIVTVIGASFGFTACLLAINLQFKAAALMLFVAILIDATDGRIARKIGGTSEFGKEIDSLSDVVCFGLTPILIYSVMLFDASLSSIVLFPYLGAAITRLARFNVNDSSIQFSGLPTPAAAGCLSTLVFIDGIPTLVSVIIVWVLAGLMVSPVKYPKRINKFGLLLLTVALLLLLLKQNTVGYYFLLAAFLTYLIPKGFYSAFLKS